MPDLTRRPENTIAFADTERWKCAYGFQSDTDPGVLYTICYDNFSAIWVCSCPGNLKRGKCKHLTRDKRSPTKFDVEQASPDRQERSLTGKEIRFTIPGERVTEFVQVTEFGTVTLEGREYGRGCILRADAFEPPSLQALIDRRVVKWQEPGSTTYIRVNIRGKYLGLNCEPGAILRTNRFYAPELATLLANGRVEYVTDRAAMASYDRTKGSAAKQPTVPDKVLQYPVGRCAYCGRDASEDHRVGCPKYATPVDTMKAALFTARFPDEPVFEPSPTNAAPPRLPSDLTIPLIPPRKLRGKGEV